MSEEKIKRPNVDQELKRLKDFQRRTLDTVFQRLYLDTKPARRFLVADEVGLGKTLVARGVITRTIDHLWDKVDRVDVVYLCSNSDIARQNVRRLTPHGIAGVSIASRITLLPLAAQDLKSRKVNVIALTPGTSLDLKGNLGVKRERALLLHMLSSHWELDFTAACRLFAGNASLQKFKTQVREFAATEKVDEDLKGQFLEAVDVICKTAKDRGEKTLRERVEALVRDFRSDPKPTSDILLQRTIIIGELRQVLARSCIIALEPDLIILDEFQRFKELLDGQSAAAEMAKQLFEYKDQSTEARVLLLSATPYKMYTVPDEAGGEDHYADFVRTASFLLGEETGQAEQLAGFLKDYRRELFRLGQGDGTGLEAARAGIESILRRIMVRTERLAVTPDRNGMLVEKPSIGVGVAPDDARSYTQVQRLARLVEHSDTMEYWKSSPWLLNFMDQYKLSRDIGALIEDGKQSREFVKAVEGAERSLLPWADVEAFRRLDPAHGRLRWLIDHTLGSGLWKLLWLPPGLRYYELGEPFREVASHSPTKALLFSAWRVVPRVVASILSHEAERRMYVASEGEGKNLKDAPDRLGNLLQVSRKDGRVAGLTVLSVIYPSSWLARACDPMLIGAEIVRSKGRAPTIDEILEEVENRIRPLFKQLTDVEVARTTPDESWYWAAPILLDRLQDQSATDQWFAGDLPTLWGVKTDKSRSIQEDSDEENGSLTEDSDGDGDQSALSDLVDRARRTSSGDLMPGGSPPKDILRTLALMAVAGPATVALRAFSRVAGPKAIDSLSARDNAAKVGVSFRTLFNQPDSTAIVRATATEAGRGGDYWMQCLEYSACGCLQAVLDEYAHLLVEEAGVFGKDPEEVVSSIAEYVVATVGLRRASVGAQDISVINGKVRSRSKNMRSRFAMRYGEERADESGDKMRADDVRRAFNSPFWPFVLATTSVGQEGLDFHLYCHAVIHWNLPPNPVDLEQREGRVHRFKGHAVRKNVAKQHARIWHSVKQGDDPWEATFEDAKKGRKNTDNDLVPYWVYPVVDGSAIERHVPTYPLSRDVERFKALRESLALYRMVFGQPRQEELLSYLSRTVAPERIAELSDRLKISLAP
jgi:hypothetical protein